MSLKIFFIISLVVLINSLEPKLEDELKEYTFTIRSCFTTVLNKKSTAIFYIYSSWRPEFNDEEKKSIFEAKVLLDNKKEYKINCGLWKTSKDPLFNVFCIFDESLPKGEYYANLEGINFIYKNKYKINLEQESTIIFKKYDSNLLDLYSSEQKIIINEKTPSYDLKFNIESYYNEQLIFFFPNNYIF